GRHHFITDCSDSTNAGLHGREGILEVTPYMGDNPLYRHGPVRVSSDHRYLEHADMTPFFWLGDTWWMSLSKRLRWPDEFRLIVADRVTKGFSVIQLVAGLYPDIPPFDQRGANEAGFPWEADYSRIAPLHRGVLGLLCALAWHRADATPLAKSDCPLRRISGRLVYGG